MKGIISITNQNTNELMFRKENVIVDGTRFLFSRLFANMGKTSDEVMWGVWGLALGSGDQLGNVHQAAPTIFEMKDPQPFRKPLYKVQFVNKVDNPDTGGFDFVPSEQWTDFVEFQTQIQGDLVNVDGSIKRVREMGLIGGGSKTGNGIAPYTPTDPLTAPFWSPSNPNDPNTMSLINYKSIPDDGILLPPDISFLISWVLAF
jgi:hypothetical protein